jgi:hypothetical protein
VVLDPRVVLAVGALELAVVLRVVRRPVQHEHAMSAQH